MSTSFHFALLVSITLLIGCNEQATYSKPDTEKKDSISQITTVGKRKKASDYVRNYNGEGNKLFAFVGKKISVDSLSDIECSMDYAFGAKYEVLQRVFGSFSEDTIEFVVFDHFGVPPFSKFEHVFLFLSANSGTYYHQKNIYNDVYLTKDRRWAGSYDMDLYEHEYNINTKVKPSIIDFEKQVSYPTKIIRLDSQIVELKYPKPYYRTRGDKAIAVYGNYVDELFILNKDSYLTARKVFVDGKLR